MQKTNIQVTKHENTTPFFLRWMVVLISVFYVGCSDTTSLQKQYELLQEQEKIRKNVLDLLVAQKYKQAEALSDTAILKAIHYSQKNLLSYAYNTQGIMFMHLAKDEKAINALQKAYTLYLSIDSTDAAANCQRIIGQVHKTNHNHLEALTSFYTVSSLVKNNKDNLLFVQNQIDLASVYLLTDQKEEARKALEELENPNLYQKSPSRFSFNMANYLMAIEQYDSALVHLNLVDKIIKTEKQYYLQPNVYAQKSIVFEKNNQTDSALAYAEKCFALKPLSDMLLQGDVKLCNSVGMTYAKQKKWKQALPYFEKTVAAYSAFPSISKEAFEAYEALYLTHFSLGNHKKSMYFLDSSIVMSNFITKQRNEEQSKWYTRLNKLKKEELARLRARYESTYKNYQFSIMGILFMIGLTSLVLLIHTYQQQHEKEVQLSSDVEQQTQELRFVNQQLQETNEELRQFSYVASHDFREPIRNMSSFASLITRGLPHKSMKEITEYTQFIRSSAMQLNDLVSSVEEFSKLSMQPASWSNVSVAQVIHVIKDVLSNQLSLRNATITFEAADGYEVPANENALFLVLKNLISNGIKYNQSEKPTIRISAFIQDEKHHIEVQDNGIGIEPKYWETVFLLFKRLQNRHEYEGSGMGLSICKKIIAQLGGTIYIKQSSPQSGTTFVCCLPLKPATITNYQTTTKL